MYVLFAENQQSFGLAAAVGGRESQDRTSQHKDCPAGEQRPGTNGGNAGSQGVDGIATIITGKKLQITMIVYFTKML